MLQLQPVVEDVIGETTTATEFSPARSTLQVVTLRNTPPGHNEPLQLWRHWPVIMGTTLEHVPACALAAFSATLLGGTSFIQVRAT